MGVLGQLKHAWNAFLDQSVQPLASWNAGVSYASRPDRLRVRTLNERSIIASIYNRIAIDVAAIHIRHVRLDDDEQYQEDIDSGLNDCLKVQANIDQAARAFRQDIVMTLFDQGCIGIVPVDTTLDPNQTGGYDIKTMRVGNIVQWYPRKVRVNLYNDQTGRREEITLDKSIVAIVENPLYSVMNEPNSTLQRLIRKLGLLDVVDEQSSSGKLDIIIGLPYVIKSEARRQQAEQRRKDIEFQLKGSQYGIAYADATEKITQLNRPAENNLLSQVEYLMTMLYGQLGITEEVMNGTADEKTMLNYENRTIEPILGAIAESMKVAFLTKTAISQGQSIEYYRDPFKLVPMSDLATMADALSRNEIVSPNEFRGYIGVKPSKDPKADQLHNSNMPDPAPPPAPAAVSAGPTPPPDPTAPDPTSDDDASIMQDAFDSINKTVDSVFNGLEDEINA